MTGMERAIERQKNLEETSNGDAVKADHDLKAGSRYVFADRYIDIIPDKDREGLSIYFYRNGKNTAAVGLSLRAALVLEEGLREILDTRFQPQIDGLAKRLEDEANK